MKRLGFHVVLVTALFLGSKLFAQQYPKLPKNLPVRMYFNVSDFSGNKANSLDAAAYELYVNEETNDLKALIDSVKAGWKLPNVTHLHINWNISPEADDDKKNDVIKKVVGEVSSLSIVKENSQLKSISFSIGEGLFLHKTDSLDYWNKKGRTENLVRAYKELQPEITKLPLKLQVYTENWGW